jgi:hypothetical protein
VPDAYCAALNQGDQRATRNLRLMHDNITCKTSLNLLSELLGISFEKIADELLKSKVNFMNEAIKEILIKLLNNEEVS